MKVIETEASYDAQKLSDRHREVARLLALSLRSRIIAERLDLAVSTVEDLRRSPMIQERVRILQAGFDKEAADLHGEIQRKGAEALALMGDVLAGRVQIPDLDDDEEGVDLPLRTKVAMDLLNRAGYAPARKVDIRGQVQGHLQIEDITAMRENAKRKKEAEGG